MRRTAFLLPSLGLLLVLLAGRQAAGEEARAVVVVLDRGLAAKDGAAAEAGNTLRIVKAVRARGTPVTLLALGCDGQGNCVATRPAATAEGLDKLGADEDYAFGGPTDPRAALGEALAAHRRTGRLDVVLLGPFDPSEGEGPKTDAAAARSLAAWNAKAPAGSRILPIGIGREGLKSLAKARGLVSGGHVVIGMAEPVVKAAPFSPLAGADGTAPALTARVRLLVDVLHLGIDTGDAAVVALTSDVAEDEVRTKILAGLHDFTLVRRQRDGRTATISYRTTGGEGVVWLCDAPAPLTFRWDELKPAVQLVGPEGEHVPAFAAIDAQADTPVRVAYRLRRSRTGPAPAWRVEAAVGSFPKGLAVVVGDEVAVSPEIAETEVAVTFTAQPATPLDARGVVTLKADGVADPLQLPYEVRVGPGKATLEVDAKVAALPAASKDAPTTIEVVAQNANVPARVKLFARSDTRHERWLTALMKSPAGEVLPWALAEPILVATGVKYTVTFRLEPGAPDTLEWPVEFNVRIAKLPGLESEGVGTIGVRKRRPRLGLVETEPSFVVEENRLMAERPFVLRLDPDGGDGEWVLQLMTTSPTISVAGESPVGWQAVGKGAGEWEIVPSGEWEGDSAKVFRETEQRIKIEIQWEEGDTPGIVEVPVRIPPRWGGRGYVFVGLAAAAVLLALLILFAMRPPPVRGMLIYTVDSLEGTVGRLDLSEIGRRTAQITADEKGRLSESKEGDAVARILPTRVGGMLEFTDKMGQRERRLLVDGLSLRVGRHIMRYVSGETGDPPPSLEEVPDLLGEEFDMAWGKIDALDDPYSEPFSEPSSEDKSSGKADDKSAAGSAAGTGGKPKGKGQGKGQAKKQGKNKGKKGKRKG